MTKQEIEIEIDLGKVFLGIAAIAIVGVIIVALVNDSPNPSPPVTVQQPFDITREPERQGIRNEMIRQGTPAPDAEEFTRALSDMEKEWRNTGRVAP